MELLDIRDRNGNVTGVVKEREKVHSDGDIHGTSHVWIVRVNDEGTLEVLLQKRARDKDAFPGCYDISSAGHLPAGQDYLASAVRELKEELGIDALEEDLHYLGIHEAYSKEVFYGKPFLNHEVSHVYVYEKEVDIDRLILQEEEVESVKWMSLEVCLNEVKNGSPGYCLFEEELLMLQKKYS